MTYLYPYTYLIGWSNLGKWYYGSRIGNKLIPEQDLWKKYFTSSKHVKKFREEYGEPDVIEIRKKFLCKEKCRLWEERVLKKLALNKECWLNVNFKHAPPLMFGKCSEKRRLSISKSRKETSKIECPHCHKFTDPGNAKFWHFDNCKFGPNKEIIRIRNSEKIKKSIRPNFQDVQTRLKQKGLDPHAHNYIFHICPHCGLHGKGPVMKRHHFSNCPKFVGLLNQS